MTTSSTEATGPPTLPIPPTSYVGGDQRRRRRRPVVVAGALILVAAAVLIFADPFGSGGPSSSGDADNGSGVQLASVTRGNLTEQTEVSATLGYAGTFTILVPGGTAPAAVTQAQQKVEADQAARSAAQAALSNTETSNQQGVASAQSSLASAQAAQTAAASTLSADQATLSSAQQKEAVDCSGDAAASSTECSTDTQNVSADQAKVTTDAQADTAAQAQVATAQAEVASTETKNAGALEQAQAQVTSAQEALSADQTTLSLAESSAASYGQTDSYTALPSVGSVITQGHSLFSIDSEPVPLLYGAVTPYRAFVAGMSSGPDVAELDASLAQLGYGKSLAAQDTFTAATAAAIDRLQGSLGLPETGRLPLGSVIFEPSAVRVTSVTPTVGAAVMAGPVLDATSTARQVTIDLDAAEQGEVKVGDQVSITLPNNQTTPGVIASVGAVAVNPPQGSSSSNPTITVEVTPTDPNVTGTLDQAPVEVYITTGSTNNALVVPVDALLALANGGYALEVVSAHGVHSLEAVTLGMFDDADGMVAVSGPNVAAGQRIVTPSV